MLKLAGRSCRGFENSWWILHPQSSEVLNARTWSTGSRGLRALFPEAGRPTASIVQKGGAATVGWTKSLMEWWEPRQQYGEKDISPFFWPNGRMPTSAEYQALKAGGFRDSSVLWTPCGFKA
jgi:hypothetical protein